MFSSEDTLCHSFANCTIFRFFLPQISNIFLQWHGTQLIIFVFSFHICNGEDSEWGWKAKFKRGFFIQTQMTYYIFLYSDLPPWESKLHITCNKWYIQRQDNVLGDRNIVTLLCIWNDEDESKKEENRQKLFEAREIILHVRCTEILFHIHYICYL